MSAGPTVTLTFAGDTTKLNQSFDAVGQAAEGMGSRVGSASAGVDATQGSLGRLGDSADGAEGKAQGFTDVIAGGVGIMQGFSDESLSMTDRLQMIGSGVADMAGGIASFLVPALTAGVSGIKAMSLALLTSPITWIVLGIAAIVVAFVLLWQNVEGFRNFWIAAWNMISGVFGAVMNGIVGIASGAWNAIRGVISGAVNSILGIARGFGNMIKGIFTGDFGMARDGAIAALGGLLSFVTTIPRAILGALGNMGSLLIGVGKDILGGLWAGISSSADWLKGKIGGLLKGLVPGWAKGFLGINSPSKVFADIGQYIPEGLAVGIEHNMGPVKDATGVMAGAAMTGYMNGTGSFTPGGSGGGTATVQFGGGTDSAFASAFQKLVRTGQIQVKVS